MSEKGKIHDPSIIFGNKFIKIFIICGCLGH